MRKRKSSLSHATSYQEMGAFWDVHDLSDYWDKTKEVTFDVDIQSEVNYYRIDKTLSEKIQTIAKRRGIHTDTLINLWVQEKLKTA